jgi:hypothetical protein
MRGGHVDKQSGWLSWGKAEGVVQRFFVKTFFALRSSLKSRGNNRRWTQMDADRKGDGEEKLFVRMFFVLLSFVARRAK